MDVPGVPDVPALLRGGASVDRRRPLLTYYDDATGERTELTAVELGDWVARTANLLLEGCGLARGGRAAVLLPPHWQTAAVLLGAWSVGVATSYRSAALAGLAVGPGADEPLDATFVSSARLDDWLENVPDARHRFVLGLGPGAEPPADVPDGYRDYVTEVRRFPASPPAYRQLRLTDAASVDGTTYREWETVARGVAEATGMRAGDRLLIEATDHGEPVGWLLAPLVAGASVVLCAHLDPAVVNARVAAERVTRVL